MMRWWQKLSARGISPVVLAGYVAVVVLFGAAFSRYYIPEKGFSYLISFGGRQPHPPISELKDLDYYVQADSDGYDAQYYVQIAMDPTLRNPELNDAVDTLAYRARRILISWASYAMGFGQPAAIMHAYVLQNAIAWLLLAGVMLWWFPPTNWSNWLRWTGVLFSFGMCVSVRNSLVDGPSLLLIAAGVFLVEKNRPWLATIVLGLGGLGKETNLLGAASLLRKEDVLSVRRWPGLILRGLLVAVPLAIWLWYIQRTVGPAADLGTRNFDWPLAAYGRKVLQVWSEVIKPQSWAHGVTTNGAFWSSLMVVTLSVQFLFLLFRPQWKQAWWRVGFSFAVLMLVLGDAVWEGYPGAASRVLLPMQLAFNVLVPYTRRWWPLLLLGNLTLLNAPVALQPPPGDGYELVGAENLISSPEAGRLRVQFSPEWHEPERYRDRYWRWSRRSAKVTIVNPHAFPIEADFKFILSALHEREMVIRGADDDELWRGLIRNDVTRVQLPAVRLAPGKNVLKFQTDDDTLGANDDPRQLSFCLKDCEIALRPAPADGVALVGPASLLGPVKDPLVTVSFVDGWFEAERTEMLYWRWSNGPAQIVVTNRHATDLKATFSFILNAISKRNIVLAEPDGRVLWSGEVSSKHSESPRVEGIVLKPGENRFYFRSDLPPSGADNDTRLLDMVVKNLVVEVRP